MGTAMPDRRADLWQARGATFEGEFSNVTRSYAGKGIVRHVW